jgi:hypothetical protein
MEWKISEAMFNKYEVSSDGHIRRLSTGRILKIRTNLRNGYSYVGITYLGKVYTLRFHRLVALAFIPNPHNYSDVNHIDCNKQNNAVENLEWCTRKYNIAHAIKNGLHRSAGRKYPQGYKKSKRSEVV